MHTRLCVNVHVFAYHLCVLVELLMLMPVRSCVPNGKPLHVPLCLCICASTSASFHLCLCACVHVLVE